MDKNEPKRIDELLTDDSFLQYCRGDEAEKLHWEKQMALDPALKEAAEKAKQLYELLCSELTDPAVESLTFRQLLQDKGYMNTAAPVPSIPAQRRRWIWAAASIFLLSILSGVWLYTGKKNTDPITQMQPGKPAPLQNDAAPGKNTATLILADGTSVLLDSTGNGEIANQGPTQIVKLQEGQILYKTDGSKTTDILYNTMQTPRGGQYKLILPDGTKVWLNAASSIRYPTAFTGNERRVSITGEVYFEVAKVSDPAKQGKFQPFVVEKDEMRIEVLGTYFNVNTYEDESDMKVTLLEGSVIVTSAGSEAPGVKLRPGQQASVNNTDALSITNDIDLEVVMAWKNGLFDFNRADIKAIMRQIGRWYDLEIIYEGNIPTREFSGKITRNTNLSNVLRILEQSNINFSIEGKTIMVKP